MEYEELVQDIFRRFPSVQKEGFKPGAYKPGLEGVRDFDAALGYPSRAIRTIHVAGTNGKGSVANMLASALSAAGYRTGLYTSPHLVDFRERCCIDGAMIPREYVHAFLEKWKPYFEAENLSFFEITTGLAFRWFADSAVDVAVIECGLGGRLDSTNIITPVLSVITSIGLDHCALLGNTLGEIALEKAGIMKPGVPCVIGETNPETAPVFDNCAASFHTGSVTSCQATKTPKCVASDVSHIMPGHKNAQIRGLGGQLVYADQVEPSLWGRQEEILEAMDLQAPVQRKNLRTVLCALDLLQREFPGDYDKFIYGIEHTAELMHFHGRWERLQEKPLVIADIGHNAHALKSNFEALEALGRPLIIIYGIMADKDLDSIIPLMPRKARYIFVTPDTPRALPAETILQKVRDFSTTLEMTEMKTAPSVKAGIKMAMDEATDDTVIYIGGSTFVVAEAL
ncbi:MAG: bifunctional folylpolyglutamate synthase/dihydrofolate synthase [Bacteroidales bacterium]|nr:bifunctional folylpolyglutamate synthase/dihydrofolate synthase [Bacteroidales bacterium]